LNSRFGELPNVPSPPDLTARQIAWICAVVALVVGIIVAWVAMWGAGGSTSALIRIPREEPLGAYVAERHDDWDFVQAATRYDGLYYYAIALDPLAGGQEHALIDAPAYRYGHAGHGWLARIVSLGSEANLPWALLLLGLAGFVVSAFAGALLAKEMTLTPWLGLGVVLNPGLVYALTVDTPETTGLAVMILGLLAWLRGRIWVAAALFILMCLIKEAFVFVPIGLGIWELLVYIQKRDRGDVWFRLGALALGPLALAAWFVYLHGKLGVWPFAEGPENLSAPIVGWAETLRLSAQQGQGAEFQVGAIGLPILVVVATGLIALTIRSLFLRGPLDAIFALSALLIGCLSWYALLYPKDLLRNISVLVFLAPYVVLTRRARQEAVGNSK
jgi:hypothetical protein